MSISIEVHPLTVLNVTDHLTRAKYMSTADKPFRVVGALLGKQEGRVLEIVNTVEIAFRFAPEADGGIKIDD
jgi:COP9 signalosome complex subunit 6